MIRAQKECLKFLNINSIIATIKAPVMRKNNVPSKPNVMYLLKIWIINNGLNRPIVIITKDKPKRVSIPSASLIILNQNFISKYYFMHHMEVLLLTHLKLINHFQNFLVYPIKLIQNRLDENFHHNLDHPNETWQNLFHHQLLS